MGNQTQIKDIKPTESNMEIKSRRMPKITWFGELPMSTGQQQSFSTI